MCERGVRETGKGERGREGEQPADSKFDALRGGGLPQLRERERRRAA